MSQGKDTKATKKFLQSAVAEQKSNQSVQKEVDPSYFI